MYYYQVTTMRVYLLQRYYPVKVLITRIYHMNVLLSTTKLLCTYNEFIDLLASNIHLHR